VKIRAEATKLAIFAIFGLAVAIVLYLTLAQTTVGASHSYSAMMTNVSGLAKGDVVRVAGVRVGQVDGLDVVGHNEIKVKFHVATDQHLTSKTQVLVRYQNLLGDRYLELSQPPGEGSPLSPGATIPADRTTPALDLNVLLNGFQPLFQGLQPEQINELATGLINTLQGRGGDIESLLAKTASLTNGLAGRDQAIGSLLTNLDVVLSSLDGHDTQFSQAVVQLKDLVQGLAQDGNPIGSALGDISHLTGVLAVLFGQVKTPLAQTLSGLNAVSSTLNRNKTRLNSTLNLLPDVYNRLDRVASHGSFFNFYLCSVQVLAGPESNPIKSPVVDSPVKRCNP
jgi:phospholipid/cholesterol/gamma-HCH transport system substrate-binding protein